MNIDWTRAHDMCVACGFLRYYRRSQPFGYRQIWEEHVRQTDEGAACEMLQAITQGARL